MIRASCIFGIVALLFCGGQSSAHAGDGPLRVLFVDMTPDGASTKASKTCVLAIRKTIASEYTIMTTMGESRLRAATGLQKDDPYATLPHLAFEKVKRSGDDPIDTVVLVDCRPEHQQLDVLLVPPAPATSRLELRDVAIDTAASAWLGPAIMRRAWVGFRL